MGKVNKDICIGCANCVAMADSLFKIEEADQKAVCYKQPETPEEHDLFKDAMDHCPVEAITDEEELKMAA